MPALRTLLLIGCLVHLAACSDDAPEDAGDTSGADAANDVSGDVSETDAGEDVADVDVDVDDTDAGMDSGDSGGADAAPDTGTEVTCGAGSPAALAACVEPERYVANLTFMAIPRPSGTAEHAAVGGDAALQLLELGYEVNIDDSFYGRGANIVAVRRGSTSPDELVVVSAHYDTIPNCSGADDNATGLAGVLEVAWAFSEYDPDRTLVLALWDEEERTKAGSWNQVDQWLAEERSIVAHFVFEMIGYTDDTPGAQSMPDGFDRVFPAFAEAITDNESRGDFIAVIANEPSQPFVDAIVEHSLTTGLKALPAVVPEILVNSTASYDLRRSDHEGSWAAGYPAMMITDTSEFRYPGYHCEDGDDSIDRLDHEFATRVISATVFAAATALSDDAPRGIVSDRLRDCDPVTNGGCDEGQKCSLLEQPGRWFALQCVDLEDDPVGLREACSRPNDVPGEDTCDVGHFCAYWGLPTSDPQPRHCLPHCETADDCGENQACVIISDSIPHHGLCTDTCAPFDEGACGEGLHCTAERVDTDGGLPWTCNRYREITEGETCTPGFDLCAEGLVCAYSLDDGVGRCGRPCDDAHPCPEETWCQFFLTADTDSDGPGVCN